MGLIDHDTLHRVMADHAAAFVEPSADRLGLRQRLGDDGVAVLRLAGAGMSLGTIPEALTTSHDPSTPRDRGDDVRSRDRGRPAKAGVENKGRS